MEYIQSRIIVLIVGWNIYGELINRVLYVIFQSHNMVQYISSSTDNLLISQEGFNHFNTDGQYWKYAILIRYLQN